MQHTHNNALKESLQISQLATQEINEIHIEIDSQTEKLLDIQKRNGKINNLLFNNSKIIGDIFKKTGVGFLVGVVLIIVLTLLLVLLKIIYFS